MYDGFISEPWKLPGQHRPVRCSTPGAGIQETTITGNLWSGSSCAGGGNRLRRRVTRYFLQGSGRGIFGHSGRRRERSNYTEVRTDRDRTWIDYKSRRNGGTINEFLPRQRPTAGAPTSWAGDFSCAEHRHTRDFLPGRDFIRSSKSHVVVKTTHYHRGDL